MRSVVSILAVAGLGVLASTSEATLISVTGGPVSVASDLEVSGSVGDELLPRISIDAPSISDTASFGEVFEIDTSFGLTITDDLASALFLEDTFILPQIFSGTGVDPFLVSAFVFERTLLLSDSTFDVTVPVLIGIDLITEWVDPFVFERSFHVSDVFVDIQESGLIVTGAVLDTTVDVPDEYLFSSGADQIVDFNATISLRIDSIEPVPVPVPEPGTLCLLTAGLLIGAARRSRGRSGTARRGSDCG